MAKLRELVTATARLLGETEASINVLSIQLRRAGMIRKEGRGLNAADMGPEDAAALLTSALAGGMATETAETTARVLKCKNFSKSEQEAWYLYHCSTFGEAFTGLIDAFIRKEIEDPGQGAFIVAVSVQRTAAFYECKIDILNKYRRDRLLFLGPTEKGKHLPMQELLAHRNDLLRRYGRKSVTEEIDEIVLSEIADLLRGNAQ